MICPTCGNRLVKVPHKERVYKGMGVWGTKTTKKEVCKYCVWKGATGPGAELRQIIKEHNR